MESWEAIKNVLDYIEVNLGEKMDIDKLACKAYLSPFYCQRLFSRLVGKPIMEYVKLRRLAKSADALLTGNDRIIDIGIAVGFENHETYTRSFRDAYGMTPSNYRKNPQPLTHFNKPDISLQYYLIDEGIPLLADGIILEISRKNLPQSRFFAGKMKDVPFPNNPGMDFLAELWCDFHKNKSKINGLKEDGNEIGVGSYDCKEGYINYFVGAEIYCEKGQNDFDNRTMSDGDYVICSFEAENFHLLTSDALDKAIAYMYNTWLPKKEISTAAFLTELYFDTTPEASYMELWFKNGSREI
ncbi:MAG: AraC family transcriptional regulator [Flexilinea sp.]